MKPSQLLGARGLITVKPPPTGSPEEPARGRGAQSGSAPLSATATARSRDCAKSPRQASASHWQRVFGDEVNGNGFLLGVLHCFWGTPFKKKKETSHCLGFQKKTTPFWFPLECQGCPFEKLSHGFTCLKPHAGNRATYPGILVACRSVPWSTSIFTWGWQDLACVLLNLVVPSEQELRI